MPTHATQRRVYDMDSNRYLKTGVADVVTALILAEGRGCRACRRSAGNRRQAAATRGVREITLSDFMTASQPIAGKTDCYALRAGADRAQKNPRSMPGMFGESMSHSDLFGWQQSLSAE